MATTNDGKNYMLDQLKTVAVKMRLLDDGMLEIQDHESAGQDKDITWGDATGGVLNMTNTPEFEIPGGTTVAAVSYRNTAGTTEYARDVIVEGERESYTNDGTFTVTSASITITDS